MLPARSPKGWAGSKFPGQPFNPELTFLDLLGQLSMPRSLTAAASNHLNPSIGRRRYFIRRWSDSTILWLNSNKGTKNDMDVWTNSSAPRYLALPDTPNFGAVQAVKFGGIIPTESRGFSSEKSYSPSRLMCCQDTTERSRRPSGAPPGPPDRRFRPTSATSRGSSSR